MCDSRKEELSNIKNIEFNEKGFIVNKDNNIRQQKGVDGYIISDLTDLSHEEFSLIGLISGDGDMKAGVEKVYQRTGKKVHIIGLKDSISKELSDFCIFHYLDTDIKSDNIEVTAAPEIPLNESITQSSIVDENFENLKLLCEYILKKKKRRVTMSSIGQNAKKFMFNYRNKKLFDILNEYEKKGRLKLTQVPNGPDMYVDLC